MKGSLTRLWSLIWFRFTFRHFSWAVESSATLFTFLSLSFVIYKMRILMVNSQGKFQHQIWCCMICVHSKGSVRCDSCCFLKSNCLLNISTIDIVVLWVFMEMNVKVLVTHSCPTLCNPMDCSLPGSFVQEILQASILEFVAISFSRDLPGQGLNLGLLHCMQILCRQSRQWRPYEMKWLYYSWWIRTSEDISPLNIWVFVHLPMTTRCKQPCLTILCA